MTEDSIIDRYSQCEVEVIYLTDGGQYRDKGRITDFDGTWLVLEKTGNELFLVPVNAVRLIKVLTPAKDRETLLLRPVSPEPDLIDGRSSSTE